MPLASLFSLQFYGPAAGAMTTGGVASSNIDIKGYGRAGVVDNSVATVPLLKATRLKNSPLITGGVGSLVTATPKARANMGLVVRVNTLSQDDVTGAVLESPIEDGLSLRQALRLMTAALAGKVSGAETTTVTIRDVNDSKSRIVATVDANGNRSALTLDTSD